VPFRLISLRLLPLLALCAAVLPLRAQPTGAPVLPLEELRPGMTGEVWTVFKGSQPEPFLVEVTGVLQNALGPGKSLIVCELTDPRVQKMGAVAGLSGSPLYIDGRVAGVLAYQIQRFETVRYAGFTPIADMLEVQSLTGTPPGLGGAVPLPALPREAARPRAAAGDWQALTPVFSASGLSPEVAALLEPQLAPLGIAFAGLGGSAAAGPAEPASAARTLAPGDAVAVSLAVGDINVSGTGTVSHVDGNRVLAFGHPMLRLGATELPMASAEVLTILPSQFNSIKISNTGGIIGTFSQDRLSAVYGELGRRPALVPVEVELPGRLGKQALQFSVVRHEQILPAVAVAGLTQALVGSNDSGLGAKGFKVTAEVAFPGQEPIGFSRLYAGPNGFAQGLAEFSRDLTQWLFNPYEQVFPEHLRFRVEETPEVPTATLDNVLVSRTSAAPGESVLVSVAWRGFQRPAALETLALPVAPDWAGRNLEIILTTGRVLDELTGRPRAVPAAQVRSFADFAGALREGRESDGLYVAVVERTALFLDQLQATPELPGSLERIARGSDETRYQRREALRPLWETRLLPGTLFNALVRRPLSVTD